MTLFGQLNDALNQIGDWADSNVVLTLSGLGVLSLALIQALKDLTPVRRWFQKWWIQHWFATRANDFNDELRSTRKLSHSNYETALQQLFELATGGAINAFYDLPSDQLVAQMNAAAQVTLDYPSHRHYYHLLTVIAQGADPVDIQIVQSVPSARAVLAVNKSLPSNYSDARTRVSHIIQRNLDGLQIAMSDRWQFCLQVAANLICIVAIEWTVVGSSTAVKVAAIPVAIVAGYLAPVMRDLVAALQQLRS